MILQAICNQREAGVAICISDKIRFQDKKTNRKKWTLYNNKENIPRRPECTRIYKSLTELIRETNKIKL